MKEYTSQMIWFAVNKNGKVVMFTEEPTKNTELGIWVSKSPYINSVIYDDICEVVQKAKMTFDHECQCIELRID